VDNTDREINLKVDSKLVLIISADDRKLNGCYVQLRFQKEKTQVAETWMLPGGKAKIV
jgi:hypothetical protein